MTLPSFLNPQAIKQAGMIVVALFALWILYMVSLSQQVANTQDLQLIKQDLVTVKSKTDTLVDQHAQIGPVMSESARIQCAACWNIADNTEEIKRCNCDPAK